MKLRTILALMLVALIATTAVGQEASDQQATDPSVQAEAGTEQAAGAATADQQQQAAGAAAEQTAGAAETPATEQAAEQQAKALPAVSPNAGAVQDPLALGEMPNLDTRTTEQGGNVPLTMPPFMELNHQGVVSPNLAEGTHTTLSLDIDSRIKRLDDALQRMTWQIQRETAWATTVRDIIQNYQYKYSKVLSSIKTHMTTTKEMRDMLSKMKAARLHEVLEADLNKASRELTELSAQSGDTSEDSGYASLKDRIGLMTVDLQKMSHEKVNKVMHQVQDSLKTAADNSVPKPSDDAIKELTANA